MKQLAVLCLAILSLAEGKDIPSYFTKCNKHNADFNKCLLESANIGWPKLIEEDKSWTPILLDQFEEEITGVVEGKFSESKISGLEDANFLDISVDLKKKVLHIIFTSPVVSFTGHSDVHGNILGLELKETVPFNTTFYGGIFNLKLRYDTVEKDKEQYLKITKHDLVYNLDKLSVHLNFADSTRGARNNKLFNDNWKVINVLSSSVFGRIFSKAFAQKIEQFFEDIPVSKLFE